MEKSKEVRWSEQFASLLQTAAVEMAASAGNLPEPEVAAVLARLNKCKFLRITPDADDGELMFDRVSGLLWEPGYRETWFDSMQRVNATLATQQKALNHGKWRLPSQTELVGFAQRPECPYRNGPRYRLFSAFGWIVKGGMVDLDEGYSGSIQKLESAGLLPVNDVFQYDLRALVMHALKSNWVVQDAAVTEGPDLLASVKAEKPRATQKATSESTTPDLQVQLRCIDSRSARLPPLDATQFTDPDKGLWEFWGLDPQELHKLGVRARNPVADLRECNVAIDFGTSSTVVAYDDNGVHKLLRIGVTDFLEAPKPEHYENPTVLEFVDFEALLKPWCSEAYRPAVLWDDVRCSHEALNNFRNNATQPEVVASILTKIKQWALREGGKTRLRVTDQTQRIEHELAPLTLRQPVKGRPLEVSEADPFDPVELYAWFLGLTINWRGRGLFLRYYMTFPVAYQSEVKEKILASFRRGLQRSLPLTLVTQPEFEQFTVEERASEPAAYAATALQCLGIEPTPEGVAYAVFDFGGGTTDFDFGYYRLPTETEADDGGWETVFEHFGSGGDAFLGGENLLEHLAYRTFCHNLEEVCRKHKISFTRPLDAQDFPGSELLLDCSQAAATNSLMLMAKLRSFWETGEVTNKTGIEKIELLGRDGKKVICEFKIPFESLQQFLQERIEVGIHNFFSALKKAFADQPPRQVQVLLAGNASRSRIVLGLFGLLDARDPLNALQTRTDELFSEVWGESSSQFTAHPPLLADDKDVYRPTCKTGVALGLLRLCPGSPTLVINHAARNVIGDAPFLHYVGRIRLGKFHVSLSQGCSYQKWVELGPARERVFVLVHSQEPRAHLGDMKEGETGLHQKRLDFAGDTSGLRVYGRAVSPHEIDICTAASAEAAQNGHVENLRRIKLG